MRPWFVQIIADAGLRVELALLGLAPDLAPVRTSWIRGDTTEELFALPVIRADTAVDAREHTRARLARLNEAIAADGDLQDSASLGVYVWREAEDDPAKASQAAFMDLQGAATLSAMVSTGVLGGGSDTPPPRSRGVRQRELAALNQAFARALHLYRNAGTDLRKLWVVFEYARDAARGKLKPPPGVADDAVASFCETANERELRHKARGTKWVYSEMDGATARSLLRALLLAWLDRENPP